MVLLWQAGSSSGLFPPQVLVSPAEVASTLASLIRFGELQGHLQISLHRLVAGFIAGAAIGLAFGTTIALRAGSKPCWRPCSRQLRQVPVLAFLPMLVLLLGIEEQFKITVVAIAAFFPVALPPSTAVRGPAEILSRGRALLLERP